jgi:ACS family hexuronate transporter-like MFS transporter
MKDLNNETAVAVAESPVSKQAGIAGSVVAHVGRYRWTVCALLFFASTLNYMDRSILGLLVPTLQKLPSQGGIGLTQGQYGMIVAIFSCAYALGYLVMGNFVDRVGTKKGYTVAVTIWTIAAMSHFLVTVPAIANHLGAGAQALARFLSHVPLIGRGGWIANVTAISGVVIGFGITRFVLGLGESGNFPAAIKAVAEWFPRKERALATGIFNSGTNIGAMIATPVVGFIVERLFSHYAYPWRYAFFATSFFALVWLVLWLVIYRSPQDHPKVSASELAYINSDPPETTTAKVRWASLLKHRQTWAFLVGKALTDPIWWFFVFWLPPFLYTKFHLSIMKMGLPLIIIYNACTVGSILGGWLPAKFLSMGWSLNKARKTSMLIYACLITPIIFAGNTSHIWVAIALISLAMSTHQAWSANLFTLTSDMFPRRAVASVVGIGGFGGSMAMMFFGTFVGFLLELTNNNYVPVFILAGSAYLIAILVIHLLAPKLTAVNLD